MAHHEMVLYIVSLLRCEVWWCVLSRIVLDVMVGEVYMVDYPVVIIIVQSASVTNDSKGLQ